MNEGTGQELSPVRPEPSSESRTDAPSGGHDYATAERDAWVTLLAVSGLGPVTFGALLDAFGSARAVMDVATSAGGAERLRARVGGDASANLAGPTTDDGTIDQVGRRVSLGADLAARICDGAMDGGRVLGRIRALGLSVVSLEDDDYPQRLRLVEMPPPVLFIHGSPSALASEHAVAIVGTRWPTDKGRLIGGWIASALARAGAVVVSGLAVGIDGVAHAAVVAEGRPTVAVLGGGHARLFPRSHARLADTIAANAGAVISELLPDTAPTRGSFPRRNRLVSGLSDATVVVEAGRRSGALITAGWALEQGRGCFLVPGAFDSPASAGCHAFLRSFPGEARVVCGIPELLEDLDLVAATSYGPLDAGGGATQSASRNAHAASVAGAGRAAVVATLGSVERALAEMLAEGPASVDDLSHRTSLGAAAILSALTLLELRGLVVAAGGRYLPAGVLACEPGRARAEGSGRQ